MGSDPGRALGSVPDLVPGSVPDFPSLLPPFVSRHSVGFDPADDSDLARRFPGVTMPDSLAHAAPKRRVEYCAGRFCVQQALRACCPESAAAVLLSGPKGEPLWPPGIVGAITHAHGCASAVVARTGDAYAIGIDSEKVLDDDVTEDILEHIASPAEIDALVDSTQWSRPTVLSVVFSAKETIFKCLYPEVGRYFDFRDAAIDGLDARSGSFSARLLVALAAGLPAGTTLEGRFACANGWVFTAMLRVSTT